MTKKQYDEKAKGRLMGKVIRAAGCWVYTGGNNTWGYGRIMYRGKKWGAHRLAYHLFIGAIPKGKFVCHRCDNPACINPKHLFLADQKSNIQDMILKGRANKARGVKHGLSKLNEVAIRVIRYFQHKISLHTLAHYYHVDPTTIKSIWLRKTWRHVT